MTIRKKQLFGAVGLASVAAMTIAACAMPVNEAAATSASGSATITVTVTGNGTNPGGPSNPGGHPSGPTGPSSSVTFVEIATINGGDLNITQSPVPIKGTSAGIDKVQIVAKYTDVDGKEKTDVLAEFNVDSNGDYAGDINLSGVYGGKDENGNKVMIAAIGYKTDGTKIEGDWIQVTYRAAQVIVDTVDVNSNGDPLVKVRFNSAIRRLMFQVLDKNGNPVFVSDTGVEEPIWVDLSEEDIKRGTISLYLPMEKYHAAPGEYRLVMIAYGASTVADSGMVRLAANDNGPIISMNTVTFLYKTNIPDVPTTGSTTGKLNISRADFVITGLLMFGTVAGFAVYLVIRKSKR